MHVQKDKRNALAPHYEKCTFIGYPQGYKGWKFYNPTTKRTVISEHTDFDECHFLTSKKRPNPSSVLPFLPADGTHPDPYVAPTLLDENGPAVSDALQVPGPWGAHQPEDPAPATPLADPAPLSAASPGPATPAPPSLPVVPAVPHSSIGIGARLPA